jgi:hypothetical protein
MRLTLEAGASAVFTEWSQPSGQLLHHTYQARRSVEANEDICEDHGVINVRSIN